MHEKKKIEMDCKKWLLREVCERKKRKCEGERKKERENSKGNVKNASNKKREIPELIKFGWKVTVRKWMKHVDWESIGKKKTLKGTKEKTRKESKRKWIMRGKKKENSKRMGRSE